MQPQSLTSTVQTPDLLTESEMPVPQSESTESCLCSYYNQTANVQVIRISDVPQLHFERVVFPGQRLMFYAPAKARLKVYTGSQAGSLLADTIICDRLQVSSQPSAA